MPAYIEVGGLSQKIPYIRFRLYPGAQIENQVLTPKRSIVEPQPDNKTGYPQADIPCTLPENDHQPPPAPQIPAMLKRLFPHNEPGKLESTPVLREGRLTRSRLLNSINMGGL